MNRFLVAASIVLSSSITLACPDLAGTFMCPGENEGELVETTVAQSVTNGVTTYSVTDVEGTYEFIADGQVRTEQEDHQDYVIIYASTNTCNASASLKAYTEVSAYVKATQQTTALAKVDLDIAKDAAGSLSMSGTATHGDGTTEAVNTVCAKK